MASEIVLLALLGPVSNKNQLRLTEFFLEVKTLHSEFSQAPPKTPLTVSEQLLACHAEKPCEYILRLRAYLTVCS